MRGQRNISDDDIREMIFLKKSVDEMAEEFGCSPRNVERRLRNLADDGNEKFTKLMAGNSFENDPRAERRECFLSIPRPSRPDTSLTGCAAALACA